MDPIEAIETLAGRMEHLLDTAQKADERVQAARSEADEWKSKVNALEARIAELEENARTREERIEAAASRVKDLLEKLPADEGENA